MDLAERVKREGACVLRLCGDLAQFIKSGRSAKTYLFETDEFLCYISQALSAIERFTTESIAAKIEPVLVESRLRDLGHIKIVLSWLYSLSKEAIDADSLSIPFSLVTFLNHIARELQKDTSVSLVVTGTSELNYFKNNLKPQRDLSQRLASSVVSDYPILSEKMGILNFPYCASSEVLINCDLFHELGHYVYESTDLEQTFFGEIEEKCLEFVQENPLPPTGHGINFVSPKVLNYVRSLLLNWTDEIFADAFAIGVLGPAFHLAYLEIEQIIPILSSHDMENLDIFGVGVDDMRKAKRLTFFETHPATNFRFRTHASWLHDQGWDKTLKTRAPEVFSELQTCRSLTVGDFVVGCVSPLDEYVDLEKKLHKWMLCLLEDMVVAVEEKVREKLVACPKPIDDFTKHDADVTPCLERGVVPSTIIRDNGAMLNPSPTTLLNCGFFFYLSGMEPLLARVKSDFSPIQKRIQYERRLNQWLAKAIDDWQVICGDGKL